MAGGPSRSGERSGSDPGTGDQRSPGGNLAACELVEPLAAGCAGELLLQRRGQGACRAGAGEELPRWVKGADGLQPTPGHHHIGGDAADRAAAGGRAPPGPGAPVQRLAAVADEPDSRTAAGLRLGLSQQRRFYGNRNDCACTACTGFGSTGQGPRMCISSTCAMAAEFLRPGCLQGNGQPDDGYLTSTVQVTTGHRPSHARGCNLNRPVSNSGSMVCPGMGGNHAARRRTWSQDSWHRRSMHSRPRIAWLPGTAAPPAPAAARRYPAHANADRVPDGPSGNRGLGREEAVWRRPAAARQAAPQQQPVCRNQ